MKFELCVIQHYVITHHPPFVPPFQTPGKGGKRSEKRCPQGKPTADTFLSDDPQSESSQVMDEI
jgi:hypothetical protein